jgi:hypothetical protein
MFHVKHFRPAFAEKNLAVMHLLADSLFCAMLETWQKDATGTSLLSRCK